MANLYRKILLYLLTTCGVLANQLNGFNFFSQVNSREKSIAVIFSLYAGQARVRHFKHTFYTQRTARND
jgi:hypothetical protein